MSTEDEVVEEDEAPDMTDYFVRSEAARQVGLTMIVSVGLETAPEHRALLVPGESGNAVGVCFVHPAPNWSSVIAKLEKTHAPLLVKWVLPIGHLPLLLAPPVN